MFRGRLRYSEFPGQGWVFDCNNRSLGSEARAVYFAKVVSKAGVTKLLRHRLVLAIGNKDVDHGVGIKLPLPESPCMFLYEASIHQKATGVG
jgi:hypothetical protein